MSIKTMMDAWKGAEGAATLQDVAGTPVVDEELLRQVNGGAWYGNVPSISAECNGGTRCDNWRYWNPF